MLGQIHDIEPVQAHNRARTFTGSTQPLMSSATRSGSCGSRTYGQTLNEVLKLVPFGLKISLVWPLGSTQNTLAVKGRHPKADCVSQLATAGNCEVPRGITFGIFAVSPNEFVCTEEKILTYQVSGWATDVVLRKVTVNSGAWFE
jgi:hypothetical protein